MRWKWGSKQEHLVPTFPPDVVKWCTQNGVKIPLMGFYLKLISHKKWSKSTIHLPWKFFSIAARSNTFLFFVIIHSNYEPFQFKNNFWTCYIKIQNIYGHWNNAGRYLQSTYWYNITKVNLVFSNYDIYAILLTYNMSTNAICIRSKKFLT